MTPAARSVRRPRHRSRRVAPSPAAVPASAPPVATTLEGAPGRLLIEISTENPTPPSVSSTALRSSHYERGRAVSARNAGGSIRHCRPGLGAVRRLRPAQGSRPTTRRWFWNGRLACKLPSDPGSAPRGMSLADFHTCECQRARRAIDLGAGQEYPDPHRVSRNCLVSTTRPGGGAAATEGSVPLHGHHHHNPSRLDRHRIFEGHRGGAAGRRGPGPRLGSLPTPLWVCSTARWPQPTCAI